MIILYRNQDSQIIVVQICPNDSIVPYCFNVGFNQLVDAIKMG